MTWTTPTFADCDHGIEPTEYMVLVAMAEFEAKTAGGIILTETTREKEGWGSTHARLLAVSPLAFTYAANWPADARKPQPGDVVFVGKYPGEEVIGRDGKPYRLCSDREIAGIIERAPDPNAEALAKVRAGLTAQYGHLIEPLTRDIEALFKEVGPDVSTYRTPGGGSVVAFDGAGVKIEGNSPAVWDEASHKRVLAVIKATFPDHARSRLHWRRRPEISQTYFDVDVPGETPVIYLRLGADAIPELETVHGS